MTSIIFSTGGETFKAIDEDHGTSAAEKQDSDMMALHTAERFIKEMRPKSTTVGLRLQVLSSYTLLASRKKADAEQALQKFVEIASTEVKWYTIGYYVVCIATERFYSCFTWHGNRSHDTEADAKGTQSTEENIKVTMEHISMWCH